MTNSPIRFDRDRALAMAREALDIEAQAVLALGQRLGDGFAQAVSTVLACSGRVVIMGMGKSGHVGRKIAATLASTGTPAMFVHPAEASHGDLGMVTAGDVVLAISNSGESEELTAILPLIKRMGVPMVAMTGRGESSLGRHADVVLDTRVDKEACPHNLAPTASTTAALALGDALAVALLDARGFGPEDFARSHPGGSLGRRLLTHVRDVMRGDDRVPAVKPDTAITDAIIAMSRGGLGLVAITDPAHTVLGIFTDGDLRRAFEKRIDLQQGDIASVMHANPRTISPDRLAVEAVEMMERLRINALLVVDADNHLIGALNMHDLFTAKVI